MADPMMQFVGVPRSMPDKRGVEDRLGDFREIYGDFEAAEAAEQASRCEQCGIPFCQVHCPLHNNIPDWLRLTATGRLEEAYELASATNNMPEICGRICPQDRLCEGNCVIEQAGHGTVTIGAVERYITDTAFEKGWIRPPSPASEKSTSIGIIGAGPAGLAAAEQLRRAGHQIHVYDRYDRAGGLLIYGIPGFKLEKEIVNRRYDLLNRGGIHFHFGADIGGDGPSFAELRSRHDALFLGTGVYKARRLSVQGTEAANVVPALDYLTASNRQGLGDEVPTFENGLLNASGRNVVVVGGGDTAMDCVRTAVRQGAKSVRCLYRRDRENMPGSMREVENAEEEGVEFLWLSAPEAFIGGDVIHAVRTIRMRLGAPDASGRRSPEPIPGSAFMLEADLVIEALGFDPEDLDVMFGEPQLKLTRWGTVTIDWDSMMTSLPGVFAGGDLVRGASLVVWGVRDGRDAARGIEQFLASAGTEAEPRLALAS